MRRLRFVKVVVPEIVAYMGLDSEPMEPNYQCSCGMDIAEEYKYCPYCGADLSWDEVVQPAKEFRKILDRL